MDNFAGWISGATLGVLVVTLFTVTKSIGRLERKVDALLKQSGIDMTALAAREVESLVKAGRTIEAIKVYREMTGAGLAEAKTAVEKL